MQGREEHKCTGKQDKETRKEEEGRKDWGSDNRTRREMWEGGRSQDRSQTPLELVNERLQLELRRVRRGAQQKMVKARDV